MFQAALSVVIPGEDVLHVIARSPVELAPVYQEILANTTPLCEANSAAFFLYDSKVLCMSASSSTSRLMF
jgi:hypothetical protein